MPKGMGKGSTTTVAQIPPKAEGVALSCDGARIRPEREVFASLRSIRVWDPKYVGSIGLFPPLFKRRT